jgi:hypothetical protein
MKKIGISILKLIIYYYIALSLLGIFILLKELFS